jgi:hypothetical protein
MVSAVALWAAAAAAQNVQPVRSVVRAAPLAPLETPKHRTQEASTEIDVAPDRAESAEEPSDSGASLGQVGWILVIQAGRGPKGELVPWEKEGAWSKAWRVPGDAGGTRYVPVFGDAEDREHVKPSGPRHLGGLAFLAAKYQAPGIAVVVREADAIAVTGWRAGAASGWTSISMPASAAVDDAKAAAVKLMAGIFPPRHGRDPEVVATERMKARVLAFRDAGEASRQYQIVVEGRGSPQALQKKIESVSGLSISEIMTTPGGYDVVLDDRSGSAEPVEKRLTQAGLPTFIDGPR